MKRLAILWVLILPFQLLAAVSNINGVVIDGVSKKPIAGAFVFINQSQQYALSDGAGQFSINDSTAPEIELVVSKKGFETLVYRLTTNKPPATIKFEMLASVFPKVSAGDSLRKKYEEIFLQRFIGMSINTRETIIGNKEALHYSFNDTTGMLMVTSDEMLQIINDGLGYLIYYDLSDFLYSVSSGATSFNGYCFFKNLSTRNEAVKIKWNERRQLAYAGSLLHFNRSIINNSLRQNGFKLHKINRISENDKGYKAALKASNILRNGSEMVGGKNVEFIEVVDTDTIPLNKVVSRNDNGEVFLNSSESIIVDYEKQTRTILGLLINEEPLPVSTFSLMNFGDQKVRICKSGLYFAKSDLFVQGFMKEKMADLLPADYQKK